MGQSSDEESPNDLRRRHADAWARSYDAHANDVYSFIFNLLRRSRREAAEIHQETWLAALKDVGTFDPSVGEFRAWIFGIARRKVALHFRQRSMTVGLPSTELVEFDSKSSGILPDDIVERSERSDIVRAALAEMAEEARSLLLSKYVDGASVNQLAEQFGRTPKSVESSLTRARQRLRELLAWYFSHDKPNVR